MKTNLNIGVAMVVFVVIYFVVTLFQPERARCAALVRLWSANAGSLSAISAASEQISQETSDQDLKFFADYLSTVAAMNDDAGIHDLSELKRGDNVDIFTDGFINGLLNPISALKSLAKTGWLIWHKSEFLTAAKALDERYSSWSGWGIFLGLVAGSVSFSAFKKPGLKRIYATSVVTVNDPGPKMLGH